MKYEYKTLQGDNYTIHDVNKLGEEGWRVVTWVITDGGVDSVMLEKVTKTQD